MGSSKCISKACKTHHKFEPAKSSTLHPDGRRLILPYGSGVCAGTLIEDTIKVGGVSLTNVSVGTIEVEPGKVWVESPFDGILGMGYPQIAMPHDLNNPVLPPFDVMMKQKLLEKNQFAFFLTTCEPAKETCDGSQLTLGGVDETKFSGEITWVKNAVYQKALGYWLVKSSSFAVAGNKVECSTPGLGCPMVVDTGTSVIVVPPVQFEKVNQTIGPVNADCSNADSLPTVSITLGGKEFSLEPKFYVLRGADENGQVQCQSGIQGMSVGEPLLWILGDPFLRKYYTVFDRDGGRVGFATANQPKQESILI